MSVSTTILQNVNQAFLRISYFISNSILHLVQVSFHFEIKMAKKWLEWTRNENDLTDLYQFQIRNFYHCKITDKQFRLSNLKEKNYSIFSTLLMLMWSKRNSFSFSSRKVKISCLYPKLHLASFKKKSTKVDYRNTFVINLCKIIRICLI